MFLIFKQMINLAETIAKQIMEKLFRVYMIKLN